MITFRINAFSLNIIRKYRHMTRHMFSLTLSQQLKIFWKFQDHKPINFHFHSRIESTVMMYPPSVCTGLKIIQTSEFFLHIVRILICAKTNKFYWMKNYQKEEKMKNIIFFINGSVLRISWSLIPDWWFNQKKLGWMIAMLFLSQGCTAR